MPILYPFRALRPEKRFAAKVSAKSTDFKTKEGLVREIQTNPISFHQVTKGHLRHQGSYQSPEKFLPFASQYINTMKADGILVSCKPSKEELHVQSGATPDDSHYGSTQAVGRPVKRCARSCKPGAEHARWAKGPRHNSPPSQ